ncbi:bifunctional sulfate adenylyltransferase/adenylylsulfate kinase [Desulfocurvibacter africanus]|uniref:Adenylylsulfate kinase n=1 Tax=Desulfocurvibacter africanus subsp. africanus str. Walvis Bay TaxID=690850 RepID=F3Z265_DESAF|nr:bifunctional sulfate adenylyltransferase/adenylylsulfate kinase [Desulfocurvibacter africanus]EGJ51274.1 adenylylsulfate kinase [Desulfocurvibacter africanus subsp. africanus str. Walvis Bay]
MTVKPQFSPYAESLLVHFRRVESIKSESVSYPSVDLGVRQLCDLELLVNRAFYPLQGFMTRDEYESVLEHMRLPDGALWPIPICLDVTEKLASSLATGESLAIRDGEGFMLAVLHVEDIWQPDLGREAEVVYGTRDPARHPGVRAFFEETKPWYVGGKIEGLHLPQHYDFPELRLTPSETHRIFSQNGWRKVIGFHTRDNLHCAHKEMILRAAREAGASILLHPVVGRPRSGDLDYFTLVHCYKQFVQKFPRNMIRLGLTPFAERFAGPREVLLQAIVRKNFGCTHYMVSEDQGDPFAANGQDLFYPRGSAQEVLAEHVGDIGITMVPIRRMVYVEDKSQYIAVDEVQPGMSVKEISSVELRRRLMEDLEIPDWYSFPEVVAELRKAYPPRHRQGFTIFLTGLSGAGKSTLAKVLLAKFMEMSDRPVTLLDGDIVRKNLSSELSFSREHRELNIRRIGFVASEITKNGGIAICAPIAPYEEPRQIVRELIQGYGGFIEVHMCTPLSVCEMRDRKGIYAKARAGLMKGVTGVDDPYIAPSNPELRIDTSEMTPTEAAQEVFLYLEEQGYIR